MSHRYPDSGVLDPMTTALLLRLCAYHNSQDSLLTYISCLLMDNPSATVLSNFTGGGTVDLV